MAASRSAVTACASERCAAAHGRSVFTKRLNNEAALSATESFVDATAVTERELLLSDDDGGGGGRDGCVGNAK